MNFVFLNTPRGRAVAARLAHNQKAGGSNPSPATLAQQNKKTRKQQNKFYYSFAFLFSCFVVLLNRVGTKAVNWGRL